VGIEERELRRVLADGWRIDAAAVEYAAVGGGSYHWLVRDREGDRRFVTVDDLDQKGWLGDTRDAVFEGLQKAMGTALALRSRATLRFVVAPIPTLGGETVRRLGSGHAVAVFPFLDGTAGTFGQVLSQRERAELVDMLAALHRSTPAAAGASVCQLKLPRRRALEAALNELDQPWRGGPFGERVRALLAARRDQLRLLLESFDQLAGRVAATGLEPVITHGEPHGGNLVRVGTELLLVDWDTVGLAPPERDLWMVVSETGEGTARYTDATGRPVDPAALALYRLRWALDDISIFVRQLRSPHRHSADTEHWWAGLQHYMEHVVQ